MPDYETTNGVFDSEYPYLHNGEQLQTHQDSYTLCNRNESVEQGLGCSRSLFPLLPLHDFQGEVLEYGFKQSFDHHAPRPISSFTVDKKIRIERFINTNILVLVQIKEAQIGREIKFPRPLALYSQ